MQNSSAGDGGSCDGGVPAVARVTDLALKYIQGLLTSAEIEVIARVEPALEPLLDKCPRKFSLPQELLEAVGRSAFDDTIWPPGVAVISRKGLTRYLRGLLDKTIAVREATDWITDVYAWDIAEPIQDRVVRNVVKEFTMGEDYVNSYVVSETAFSTFIWHLQHTEPEQHEIAERGIFVAYRADFFITILEQWYRQELTVADVQDQFLRQIAAGRASMKPMLLDWCTVLRGLRRDRLPVSFPVAMVSCMTRHANPTACKAEWDLGAAQDP